MLILKTMLQYLTDLDFFGLFMKIIRTIFLALDGIIYAIISYCYEVFNFISEIRVFENEDMVNLGNRIYILIGVVSLFLVAYTLLNAIINPDNATKDKNKSFSGIVKNITLAVIGIAIIPTIFDYAYEFQSRVLCNNVIQKFFLENNITEDDDTRNKMGAQMSLYLFKSFYYVKGNEDNVSLDENDNSSWESKAQSIVSDNDSSYNLSMAFSDIELGNKSVSEALGDFDDSIDSGKLGYLFLISTIAGIFCTYVMLGFVIDMGVRAVKLAYLQLIAPLPVLTLVLPNQKKVFDAWLKKTTSCFIEVFVRIIAMSFAFYAIKYLRPWIFNDMSTVSCGKTVGAVTKLLAQAAFIVGVFAFLKQLPKLIKDLMPGLDSAGFKLGFGNAFAEAGGFQMLGAAGGFASSAAKNAAISGSRAFQNAKQNYNQKPGFGRLLGGTFATIAGSAAGAATGGLKGGYKSFIGSKDAKKWSDSKSAADKAAEEVIEERFKKEDQEQANARAHEDWGIQDYAEDVFSNFVSSSRANYIREKAKQEEISKITAAEKAIDDKYASIIDKNKDKIVYDGKTISAWEQQEATAKSYLDGLAKQKAEMVANGATTAAIKNIDDEIEKAQDNVIKAHSNVTKASRETKKLMHRNPSNILTNELDDSGNYKKFTFKAEDDAIIDQLYVDYNSMLKSHIGALSGNEKLYKKAQAILNDVSKQSGEEAQKDRFRQLIENQVDVVNGNSKEYNFIDNVKIESALVTEKMNKEGEAARKQQENKK